ncbi:hypothetical protein J2Z37_001715 [Ammoniphilus resinae]|uniref:Uncharacterized protein n=1 Tax=Ammoniphilus resinae TaxID=861532 RepID=A0ABS4GN77_9BACL|nr:hypothetical protein [Ammoniphilus resinae]
MPGVSIRISIHHVAVITAVLTLWLTVVMVQGVVMVVFVMLIVSVCRASHFVRTLASTMRFFTALLTFFPSHIRLPL